MENTNKYQRSKIYRLVNSVDDEIYIGSTYEALSKRKTKHKCKAKTCPNRNLYQHLNKIGWDNVDIILIEKYPCSSIEELKARERHWIELMKPNLNKIIPLRTRQEWYELHNEKWREYHKEYYKQNQDIIKGKTKQYKEQNIKKIQEYHKRYREQNKEQVQEYHKKYREQNKDNICGKIKCECGSEVRRSNLATHKKTAKHQQLMEQQNNIS